MKKQKIFRFFLKIKKINPDKFTLYMKENKPKIYTETKRLICDWSDNKDYLVRYTMLELYVRNGTVVEIFHEIISPKQSK